MGKKTADEVITEIINGGCDLKLYEQLDLIRQELNAKDSIIIKYRDLATNAIEYDKLKTKGWCE